MLNELSSNKKEKTSRTFRSKNKKNLQVNSNNTLTSQNTKKDTFLLSTKETINTLITDTNYEKEIPLTEGNNLNYRLIYDKINKMIITPIKQEHNSKQEIISELENKTNELLSNNKSLQSQLSECKNKVLTLETETKILVNEIEKLKIENISINKEINKLKKENYSTQSLINISNKEKVINENECENIGNEIFDYKHDTNKYKNLNDMITYEIKNMRSALYLILKQNENLKIKINNSSTNQKKQEKNLKFILNKFTDK